MRRGLLLLLLAVLAPALAACTGGDDDPPPRPGISPGASSPDGDTATPGEAVAEPPPVNACYRLTWTDAIAPTNDSAPVSCSAEHTSRTFAVGTYDDEAGGHLLAVDSAAVQKQVAAACPRRLRRYLGGSVEQLRLSMLRAIWFTPTVEQSTAGARWYRCEVIALAADERLAPLPRRVEGALARPRQRNRFAMCATAAPGRPAFSRVICSARHSWRAVATVDLPQGRYPGTARVRRAGQAPCEDVGRERAADPLSFRWGYEWPTRAQWRAGQTYGRCWIPG